MVTGVVRRVPVHILRLEKIRVRIRFLLPEGGMLPNSWNQFLRILMTKPRRQGCRGQTRPERTYTAFESRVGLTRGDIGGMESPGTAVLE